MPVPEVVQLVGPSFGVGGLGLDLHDLWLMAWGSGLGFTVQDLGLRVGGGWYIAEFSARRSAPSLSSVRLV